MPTPATSRPSRTGAATPLPRIAPRVTRLRAKDTQSTTSTPTTTTTSDGSGAIGMGTPSVPPIPTLHKTPSRFLLKSKESLRKVSDKLTSSSHQTQTPALKKSKLDPAVSETYSESLQAYLRIRPAPLDAIQDPNVRPYLEIQGDKDVLMRAPSDPHRPHVPKQPHLFSFDRVFPPTTSQSDFFTSTTLPLVEKALKGENGLVFAYGVSNSGKTYTIQGSPEERGTLPRAIDVVFNSIAGLESKASLRCVGLADVESSSGPDEHARLFDGMPRDLGDVIDETVKVDRNFSYAVFVSYAEVYNEKIFDLLDSLVPVPATPPQSRHNLSALNSTRPSSAFALSGAFGSSMSLAALANGGGGVLRRKALVLKNDPEGNGKYIAGLNEIRVRTREEAQAVFRSGQRARQVFGTLANRESSRSHGIFTLKIVRIHNGAPEDPDSAQVSRLAIVDLAGSERTKNTQNTGDRLREAGNINKSLMVLGQCLEVLRSNQQKMASPAVAGMKKKLAVVPFRHSKLTEVFQNFFVGDGRAVMIVHVNPFDTGFDENSHVMRFSAIAREIQTTASNKVGFPLLKRQISAQFGALKQAVTGHHTTSQKIKVMVPVMPKIQEGAASFAPSKQAAGDSHYGMRESQGFVMVEEELEVVEEDESEDEGDEGQDLLVEHLFDQLKELKTRLYESEMRNAAIEVEVREEVAREMSETLSRMQITYDKRIQDQVAASEFKTDRKIDIISRTMATPSALRHERYADTPESATSEESSSVDQSFQSAVDRSYDASGDISEISNTDPFLVFRRADGTEVEPIDRSIPQVIISRASLAEGDDGSSQVDEDEDDDGGSTLSATDTAEDDDDDEDAVVMRVTTTTSRASPVKEEETISEDELASDEVDGLDSDLEEEEEEQDESLDEERNASVDLQSVGDDGDEEGEEEDSEDEDDAEEDEDDEVESEESSFAITEDSASSAEPSPEIRRTSTKPKSRVTQSPTKSRQAKALKSPVRTRDSPAVPAPSASKGKAIPASTSDRSLGRGKKILGEIVIQDDSLDEIEVLDAQTPLKAKKKRTLGKKIVTEDEMTFFDAKIGGAEVRRMVKGGF